MRKIGIPFIGLMFLVITTACQSGSSDSNSSKDQGENKVGTEVIQNPEGNQNKNQMPEFSFEKGKHDFGKITQGEKVAHSFKFRNQGEAPLVISNANPSCGCTVPNYPKKPIAAGETAYIDVVFDSEGRMGQFNKSVTLMANNKGEPYKLYITGTVVK